MRRPAVDAVPVELLTTEQTAELLAVSARTLEDWRYNRTGPPFVRAGRAVRYRRSDLGRWVESNTVQIGGAA